MSEVEAVVPAAITTEAATEPAIAQAPTAAVSTAEVVKATAAPETAATTEVKPPVVPEKYELKLPEGSVLKPSDIERVSSYAKEQGLSQDQAQKVLELEHAATASYAKALDAEFKAKQESWIQTSTNDPEIGGAAFKENAELAYRAVQKFATPEFVKALETTGLGNHPELVRTFLRIGKAMGSDSLVRPGSSDPVGKRSVADILYPSK